MGGRWPGPDHPRIRGEHPYFSGSLRRQSGSSPHTRGARVDGEDEWISRGIIPAYAGSTTPASCPCSSASDHPRIRGEHLPKPPAKTGSVGSSPHTRGAQDLIEDLEGEDRIIPAYAGSTPEALYSHLIWPDHPRIRGEHGILGGGPSMGEGSSPHTRGARRSARR